VELTRVESKQEFERLEKEERERKEKAGIKVGKQVAVRGEEDDLQ
jgi:hypothetical protein